MPIKQIQLRGISRAPSDRMSEDGGCAESLNVHLDNTELAPTLPPGSVTSMGYVPDDPHTNVVFIHQTQDRNILIVLINDTSNYVGFTTDAAVINILELDDSEELVDIKNRGNLLMIYTNLHTHYAKYSLEDNNYTYLGTKIPIPLIEFKDKAYGLDDKVTTKRFSEIKEQDPIYLLSAYDWNRIIKNEFLPTDLDAKYKAEINEIISTYWDMLENIIAANRSRGYFSNAVMARYALKLYDGTYIYQSTPVLLGAKGSGHLANRCFYLSHDQPQDQHTVFSFSAEIAAHSIHQVTAKFKEEYNISNWFELIQSIDLFISTDIYYPALHSEFESLVEDGTTSGISSAHLVLKDAMAYEEETIFTDASNFYKIASFPVEDLHELEDGYLIEPRSQDILVTQMTLEDDQLSHHDYGTISESIEYNNRIILVGSKVSLYPGYPLFQAVTNISGIASGNLPKLSEDYKMIFWVKDDNGDTHKVWTNLSYPTDETNVFAARYICYPDPKCYKAQLVAPVGSNEFEIYEFPMKEHPGLNCSYYFRHFGENLLYDNPEEISTDPTQNIDNAEAYYENRRQILMSEVNNPFIFPLVTRVTMPSELIGLATTTKALSTGQFGEFPLYAFTSQGIWALPISDTGIIVSSKPTTRDVAIKGTIRPIDDAIIFVTNKGVMLLDGSTVICISEGMNGEHYVLDSELYHALNEDDCPWRNYIPPIDDGSSFITFMQAAKVAYDYTGNRLIFFSPDIVNYQYVYMLSTQSWHKISQENAMDNVRILNSYPDAIISCIQDGDSKLLDFTTDWAKQAEGETLTNTTKGVIVTRPLDLGEPDVRKIIRRIRVRGHYNKGNVQYALLGSMDGLRYGLLDSLGRGSYMSFRIALLCDLAPTERISLIDVEYENRFTNRLR